MTIFPGCTSATDYHAAYKLGLEVLKFFPAEQSGGLDKIKAMAAPYVGMKFMPTGGIKENNVNDYLNDPVILACGGTWMVKKELIEAEQWEEITRICKDAVKTMLGFSIHHLGINCANEEEASATAKALCALFGFPYKPGNSSIFAGTAVECMKAPFLGDNGHLAIGTNNVDRAIYHLGRQGVEFDESTRKTDAKGNTKAIYIKGQIGGFAIHLVKK